ncbi:MAG: hypothetical protein CM1200mP2_58110 [Planctomycetaceae bacterium]|nr:MAG: hypothetical protein CM1200mP2_58110 [Planctomycetaceae bacterium]
MQVGGQAIADVDHGMQSAGFEQRDGLGEPWREVQVVSVETAAKMAGDQYSVAGLRPASEPRATGRRFADHRHADHERAVGAGGVASGQCHSGLPGQARQARVQPLGRLSVPAPRQGD